MKKGIYRIEKPPLLLLHERMEFMGRFDDLFSKMKKGPDTTKERKALIQNMITQAEILLGEGRETQAISIYRQILELEPNVTAQYNLGTLYAQGRGVKRDFVEGAYWFRKAASEGDQQAEEMFLKCTLDYARGSIEKNTSYKELFEKMLLFVERIYPGRDNIQAANDELYEIAAYFFNKKDFGKAEKFFRAAAEFGDEGRSQNILGVLYNAGAGVEKNDLYALYWFDRAADHGIEAAATDRDGIFNAYRSSLSREEFLEQLDILATSCAAGTADIPKDTKKAIYWKNCFAKA